MILKNIEVTNFRNYENLKLTLNKNTNIIYGDNGGGKTNILESIFVLALTKSHRALSQSDLINSGKENALIKGIILNEIPYNLELSLTKTTKQVKIDNNPINKIGEYISMMNIIIFYADDLELIRGFPSNRRKYLNLQLSQISKNYYNTLNDYNKLLKIRNDHLKKISNKEPIDEGYFEILTDYLIEKSIFIYQMRQKYIERLNKICPDIYKDITGNNNFKIKYLPSINLKDTDNDIIRNEMKKDETPVVKEEKTEKKEDVKKEEAKKEKKEKTEEGEKEEKKEDVKKEKKDFKGKKTENKEEPKKEKVSEGAK